MYNNVKKGLFIGYTDTSSQIYYWGMDTKLVNNFKHVRFDEGINNLEIPTPNFIQLCVALGRTLLEDKEEVPIIVTTTLDSQHTPFPIIYCVPVWVICDHDILGIILGYFPDINRVYLKDIIIITSCSKIEVCRNKFRGTYIFQIRNAPVVTLNDSEEKIDTSI